MPGVDIPADAKITNLQFDGCHLSCDIHHRDHFVTKRFTYNIDVDAAQMHRKNWMKKERK